MAKSNQTDPSNRFSFALLAKLYMLTLTVVQWNHDRRQKKMHEKKKNIKDPTGNAIIEEEYQFFRIKKYPRAIANIMMNFI